MKITLIHGDNQVAARDRFLKIVETIKARGWDVVVINSTTKLADQLTSNSLFSDNILFVRENNVDKISPEDFTWMSKNFTGYNINLLLYHKGNLAKTVVNKFPKETKVENYDLPKELFKFLEIIYPGNSQEVLKFFHNLIKTEAVELIFTMLARQVKDLYWIMMDEKSTGYPSWRIGKLKSQAKRFTQKQLESFINELSEIDIKTKTSQGQLTHLLDFLFVKTLE